MFDNEDLRNFLSQATYAIMNEYESQMMCDKTGLSIDEIAKLVDALIITKGANGSTVYNNGNVVEVGSASIDGAIDPTGCGDAYRGGLMYGMVKGYDWKVCAQIGTLCGAIKIEQAGPQNHNFTIDDFATRYENSFGEVYPR